MKKRKIGEDLDVGPPLCHLTSAAVGGVGAVLAAMLAAVLVSVLFSVLEAHPGLMSGAGVLYNGSTSEPCVSSGFSEFCFFCQIF